MPFLPNTSKEEGEKVAGCRPQGQMLAVTMQALGKGPHFCSHHCLHPEAENVETEFWTFPNGNIFYSDTNFCVTWSMIPKAPPRHPLGVLPSSSRLKTKSNPPPPLATYNNLPELIVLNHFFIFFSPNLVFLHFFLIPGFSLTNIKKNPQQPTSNDS